MKKIISSTYFLNGRKYDTETAKCVGNWNNGYSCNDFKYVKESLYCKKTGEFFLYGEGGAMTEYAESYAGNTYGSERIIPLTEDEAKEWAENKLDADDYESIFGPVEE